MNFILDPSLVLYLPLYELDGASSKSKDAHGHLSTVTGALWRPNGRYFDGTDDYIQIPNHPSFNVTEITIEQWVYFDVITQTAHSGFVTKDEAWRAAMDGDGRSFRCDVWTAGGAQTFETLTDFAALRNYHCVATYRNGDARLYINGVEDFSTNVITGNMVSSGNTMYIGSDRLAANRYFDGVIGEIRIYSRVLTPLEIQHNYLATKWRYR